MSEEILEQIEIVNKILYDICSKLDKLENIDYRLVLNQHEYMMYEKMKTFIRYEIGVNIEKLDELESKDNDENN